MAKMTCARSKDEVDEVHALTEIANGKKRNNLIWFFYLVSFGRDPAQPEQPGEANHQHGPLPA